MIIKYPIPIKHNGVEYQESEIRTPTPGVIADAKKIIDTGDKFSGIQVFIEGVTLSIKSESKETSDKIEIKTILKYVPYRTAEWIMIKAMLLLDSNDAIEGYYTCPRCNEVLICEQKKDDSGDLIYDTRDHISDLPISFSEYNEDISLSLTEKVDILINGQLVDSVASFVIENPTLRHCIAAFQQVGDKDEMRLQFAIYSESLKKINNTEIDQKWKQRHGKFLFENMKNFKGDFINLTNQVNKFGLEKKVEKICKKCGKEWRATVNTSNFFDLGASAM